MNSFWDFLWYLVYIFLFVAYLIVLFQIVGDLFRDKELGGWWKALWIVCLIFAPFLAALVYVIARGKGMAERHAATAEEAKAQADQYIRSVVTGPSAPDQIATAKSLLDSGAISREEFEQLKAKALA
jgi:hypothetical protein